MRIELHREIFEDSDLRRQWNEVVFRTERPQVFYTWEWAFAMQSAYRPFLKPLLFLAYEGNELLGVASLAIDDSEKNVGFLAAATSDYCDFVSRPEIRFRLVDAVVHQLRGMGIERLKLASIPADSSSAAALSRAAGSSGYHVFRHPAQVCAEVSLGRGEQRQMLRATLLGKKLLRRSLRGMEAEGPMTLVHLRSRAEIEGNLSEFTRAHIARFLITQRISNLTRPERRCFLAELGQLLSDSGWLCLSRLNFGERAVAWNYGFQFGGSWFWYQPTFESELEQYSPGYCLLSKIVAEACETTTLDAVDLGVGAEGYKERFANAGQQTVDVSLNKDFWPHSREAVRYWGARVIKLSPKLESFVRGGLSRLESARGSLRDGRSCSTIEWGIKQARNRIASSDEVFFYEWMGNTTIRESPAGVELKPVDLGLLTEGATLYFDDAEATSYLLRATQRLRRESGSGFALTVAGREPVHYCWAREFDGFYMEELRIRLTAAVSNAVMIFDCWTPSAVRGHGYYGAAVSRVAALLSSAGKAPWIFSAARNTSSVRGIERSGFQLRYSLVRRKILFWQEVRKQASVTGAAAKVVNRG